MNTRKLEQLLKRNDFSCAKVTLGNGESYCIVLSISKWQPKYMYIAFSDKYLHCFDFAEPTSPRCHESSTNWRQN